SLSFFSSRRRHTRFSRDWSSDVCSSDLDREQRTLLAANTTVITGLTAWSHHLWPISGCELLCRFPDAASETLHLFRVLGRRAPRSEERRVGKECSCRRAAEPQ